MSFKERLDPLDYAPVPDFSTALPITADTRNNIKIDARAAQEQVLKRAKKRAYRQTLNRQKAQSAFLGEIARHLGIPVRYTDARFHSCVLERLCQHSLRDGQSQYDFTVNDTQGKKLTLTLTTLNYKSAFLSINGLKATLTAFETKAPPACAACNALLDLLATGIKLDSLRMAQPVPEPYMPRPSYRDDSLIGARRTTPATAAP